MLKKILIGLFVLGLVIGFFAFQKYQRFFAPNVPETLEDPFVEIPTGANFEELVQRLVNAKLIIDTVSFVETADFMKYRRPKMRAGRYEIKPGWSNRKLVQHLRGGKQATVKVVLTTERMPENVAAKAARFIEADSLQIVSLLENDTFIQKLGYTKETLQSLFIPNTYDFFWNTTAEQFIQRMVKEHKAFWEKEGRLEKAQQKNMTPAEVYTLASILEKETNQKAEKKRMAGVYTNRLERGIPLQADPTCVFATKDFDTKRVTNYHTEFVSPYNTYLNAGLPPGPIAMASISSIDAVLNKEDHDYIYFCAKGDGTGFHNFAKSLRGHNQNVNIYVRNLKQRGLR